MGTHGRHDLGRVAPSMIAEGLGLGLMNDGKAHGSTKTDGYRIGDNEVKRMCQHR
jgi:hypothetical protein